MNSDPSQANDDLDYGATLRGYREKQRHFERFVLLRMLGRGGMGEVWLARDEMLKEEVALKFLPQEALRDDSAIEDLKRETSRSRKLSHVNIVRVHDLHWSKDFGAIAMEVVNGSTLSRIRAQQAGGYLETGHPGLSEWIEQVCAALEYAHTEAKIVHRDIKPSNVMVEAQSGRVKLADFGISRSLSDTMTRNTRSEGGGGWTGGTLVYMSPQHLMGYSPSVSDDVYALGAMIYELLTSKPPFYTGSIERQIDSVVPPSMKERRVELGIEGAGKIPQIWEEVVAACLAKDAEDRPESAAALWSELSGGVAKKRKKVVKPGEEKSGKGKKFGVMTAVGMLAVVAAAGWWYGVEAPKEEIADSVKTDKSVKSAKPAVDKAAAESALMTSLKIGSEPGGAKIVIDGEALGVTSGGGLLEKKLKAESLSASSKDSPYVNSLGMEFVPVPGKPGVLMCRTETRVRDFRAYAQATDYVQSGGAYVLEEKKNDEGKYSLGWELDKEASWEKPGFEQSEDHPVVCVSWDEAQAFCKWMTQQNPGYSYRLPSDGEWSAAVGSLGKYPWGNEWPAPKGAGNYFGKEVMNSFKSEWSVAYDYEDGAERTARVGGYKMNRFGFYDLGGNVWEWCEDWYRDELNDSDVVADLKKRGIDDKGARTYRVLRGGSWSNYKEFYLRSSRRGGNTPAKRIDDFGFRLVVVGVGG